jgi:hypothetical protein
MYMDQRLSLMAFSLLPLTPYRGITHLREQGHSRPFFPLTQQYLSWEVEAQAVVELVEEVEVEAL